jgi:hypothetical protein
MVNIAANTVVAILSATQKAYIENVTIAGGNVEATSILNDGIDEGAVAEIGSSFDEAGYNALDEIGFDFSAVSAKINIATALSDAANYAYICGASIGNAAARAGAVTVKVNGQSLATAQIQEAAASIGLISLGLTPLYADASGDFKAYIDTTGANIYAASILVDNTYTSRANAQTTQAVAGFMQVCRCRRQYGHSHCSPMPRLPSKATGSYQLPAPYRLLQTGL